MWKHGQTQDSCCLYAVTYYTSLYFIVIVVQFVLVSRSTAHCGGIIRLNDIMLNYRPYRSTVNVVKDDMRLID